MVGVVTTRFHANDTSGFDLPEGSRYAAIKDIMAGWVSGANVPKGCSAEEFVEGLVDDVLGSSSRSWGLVFRGPHAGAVKFVMQWLPTWCAVRGCVEHAIPMYALVLVADENARQDALLSQNQGLKELTKRYAADSKI